MFKKLVFFLMISCVLFAARLPEVGGDEGTWGNILNEFLNVSLNESGFLRAAKVLQALEDQNLSIGEQILFSDQGLISFDGTNFVFNKPASVLGSLTSSNIISNLLNVNKSSILSTPFVSGTGTISKYGGNCTVFSSSDVFADLEVGDEIQVGNDIVYVVNKISDSSVEVRPCGIEWTDTQFNYSKPSLKIKNYGNNLSFVIGTSGKINSDLNLASGNSIVGNGDDFLIKATQGALYFSDPATLSFYSSDSTFNDSTMMFQANGEEGTFFLGAKNYGVPLFIYDATGDPSHYLIKFVPGPDSENIFGDSAFEHTWVFRDEGKNIFRISGPDDEISVGDSGREYIFSIKDSSGDNLVQFVPGPDAESFFGDSSLEHTWVFRDEGKNIFRISGPDDEISVGDSDRVYIFSIKDSSGDNLVQFVPGPDSESFFGNSSLEHTWVFRDEGKNIFRISGPDDEISVGDLNRGYVFTIKDASGGNLMQFVPGPDSTSTFGSDKQDNIFVFRNSGGDLLTIHGPDAEVRAGSQTLFYPPIKSTPPTCDSATKGAIYYDSDDNNFYGCNSTAWVKLNN